MNTLPNCHCIYRLRKSLPLGIEVRTILKGILQQMRNRYHIQGTHQKPIYQSKILHKCRHNGHPKYIQGQGFQPFTPPPQFIVILKKSFPQINWANKGLEIMDGEYLS